MRQVLEFSHGLEAVNGIPRKPADGLRNDPVDSPRFAVGDHLFELGSAFGARARLAFVSVTVLWTILQWLKNERERCIFSI
ncbi:MAG: hypothetical protein PHG12_10425, partial [Sphaerochaeta sp.]|nr:hypothetical protein [Sphaerochaeta sp.]